MLQYYELEAGNRLPRADEYDEYLEGEFDGPDE